MNRKEARFQEKQKRYKGPKRLKPMYRRKSFMLHDPSKNNRSSYGKTMYFKESVEYKSNV
jgi:hypothetical protein